MNAESREDLQHIVEKFERTYDRMGLYIIGDQYQKPSFQTVSVTGWKCEELVNVNIWG